MDKAKEFKRWVTKEVSQIHYDYLESKTISEMCPRIKTLEYIEKSCRYDKQTHEMLKTFLKHGKISIDIFPTY